jgi:glycosyltransferase involved in cell wall biosynthesis
VVDGKTGFIIEKRDAKALAEKIGLLLRDRELAHRMGHAGRVHAVEHFTRERMAAQVAELYEQAMVAAQAA